MKTIEGVTVFESAKELARFRGHEEVMPILYGMLAGAGFFLLLVSVLAKVPGIAFVGGAGLVLIAGVLRCITRCFRLEGRIGEDLAPHVKILPKSGCRGDDICAVRRILEAVREQGRCLTRYESLGVESEFSVCIIQVPEAGSKARAKLALNAHD